MVISVEYRCAPAFVYPAAHEDAEDAVAFVTANAKKWLQADPDKLSVSGSPAGANLMFVAGEKAKVAVGFYATVSGMLDFGTHGM